MSRIKKKASLELIERIGSKVTHLPKTGVFSEKLTIYVRFTVETFNKFLKADYEL